MCMEDIRIGRETGGTVRQFGTLGANPVRIAPADPTRTRLIVSTDGVADAFLVPQGYAFSAGTGFVLTPRNPVTVMRVEEWGSLLRGEWWVTDTGGGQVVTVADMGLQRE